MMPYSNPAGFPWHSLRLGEAVYFAGHVEQRGSDARAAWHSAHAFQQRRPEYHFARKTIREGAFCRLRIMRLDDSAPRKPAARLAIGDAVTVPGAIGDGMAADSVIAEFAEYAAGKPGFRFRVQRKFGAVKIIRIA